MTTVLRHALSGARQTLREAGQPGACPAAFGAQRARRVLLDSLPLGDHARLYREHDGVCLRHFLTAAQVAERDVLGLHWFAEQVRERNPSLQNDPGELCATHLHDVTVIDEAAAGFAARRQQAAKVGQFQQLLDRSASGRAHRRPGGGRA